MPVINNINTFNREKPRSTKNKNLFQPLFESSLFKADLNQYSLLFKIIFYILRGLCLIFFLIYLLFKMIFIGIVGLCNQSIIFRRIFIAFLIFLVIFLIDFFAHFGKIYPGVYVSDIDLGWKSKEEAVQILDSELTNRLNTNNVIIYGNQKSKEIGDSYDAAYLNEQLNVDSAKSSVIFWKTNSSDLDASLPVNDIVDDALNSPRGFNNIFKRLQALFFTLHIDPYAQYSNDAIGLQINQINEALGKPVVNPTCVINDGAVSAINGNDGILVDFNEFEKSLNSAFFQKDDTNSNFVVQLNEKKTDVTYATAQKMSEKLNLWLDVPIKFQYKDTVWNAQRADIGSCINVNVTNRDVEDQQSCSNPSVSQDNKCLSCSVNNNNLSSLLMQYLNIHNDDSGYTLNFINQDNNIFVKTQGTFEIPNIADCSKKFNDVYLNNIYVFDNNKYNNSDESCPSNLKIDIESSEVDDYLPFDYALNIGLVQQISTYSTSYTSGAGTENRNKNIGIASSYLDNSICKANGGTWSFNDVVGDTTPDKGYLEAGTIVNDRYSKSVGGGVCQVATTIFNAVYESGLDIITRHNHDLYISSYPVGRDASIAYPYMDFIWQNNLNSDVLVVSESTGYSISVSLYGINPQYNVKTELGQWSEGEKYKQVFVVDPSKEPNSKFTQTEGSDGKSITIKRLVYDKNGLLIKSEEYVSKYNPKNEIIVLGPGDEANHLLEEKNARLKNETDNW